MHRSPAGRAALVKFYHPEQSCSLSARIATADSQTIRLKPLTVSIMVVRRILHARMFTAIIRPRCATL
jgi:hypothetical protein